MARAFILHIDMDAFFASVEQLDDPSLRGRCVIVGGPSRRGVVTAASYEARKFGIHSAMPIFQARQRCGQLVIVPPRRKRYTQLSRQIMDTLRTFSPLVEPISIDEAFVDITGCSRLHGTPRQTVGAIKQAIVSATGLTCSVGLAPNKFLAKIASDLEKPNGLTIIQPEAVFAFIDTLPIGKVPGVGKRARGQLAALGIKTLGQVRQVDQGLLAAKLGKFGYRLIELAHGRDDSPVTTQREAKSISSETTLAEDTWDRKLLAGYLLAQSQTVAAELRRKNFKARTIVLKIKGADFKLHSRRRTLPQPMQSADCIYQVATDLLRTYALTQPVRLVGVGVTGLQPAAMPEQAQLFPDEQYRQDQRWEKVDKAMDAVTERFGKLAVARGTIPGKR